MFLVIARSDEVMNIFPRTDWRSVTVMSFCDVSQTEKPFNIFFKQ